MAYTQIKPKRQPSSCIEENPTAQSICLGGVWINLSAIARSQGIDKTYLSRIFSGDRPNPTIGYAMRIAAAIGMSVEDFIASLQERHTLIKLKHSEAEIQYLTRVIEEDEDDIATMKRGKPVVPRMPGQRLPA